MRWLCLPAPAYLAVWGVSDANLLLISYHHLHWGEKLTYCRTSLVQGKEKQLILPPVITIGMSNVVERLGHSSVAITLDTYSDVPPDLQKATAYRIKEDLQAGLPETKQLRFISKTLAILPSSGFCGYYKLHVTIVQIVR